MHQILDYFLHMDAHLIQGVNVLGPWFYVVLFLVVFCETGLVVTPFLPGDSLLFAVGALAAADRSHLSLPLLAVLLVIAAVAGDAVNYAIGHVLGPVVFKREDSWWLHKKHLVRAQEFYERYGGKAIFLSRFVPIVRTFAPFVAGIGRMSYRRFAAWNVVGALTWVLTFLFAGYFFGNQPVIKRNFHYVIVAIIVISLVPIVVEALRARRQERPAL
ncbi:MAG: rane-associated protein [Acidobacteriota bacterium]|jgi:membrane-associated protein|nr:rane-associated protein [Acidobacteriota bacterium]